MVSRFLCPKQAVFWREDWAVLCLAWLVHGHALPRSLHRVVCLPVWSHHSGSLPCQVRETHGGACFGSLHFEVVWFFTSFSISGGNVKSFSRSPMSLVLTALVFCYHGSGSYNSRQMYEQSNIHGQLTPIQQLQVVPFLSFSLS